MGDFWPGYECQESSTRAEEAVGYTVSADLTDSLKRICFLPLQTQLFGGLNFLLKGHTHIDPRPLPPLRMNLELPTHEACTFSHASYAQAHSIPHLHHLESM